MDRTSFRPVLCALALVVVSCNSRTVTPDPTVSTTASDYPDFGSASGSLNATSDTLPLIACSKNQRSDSAAASIGAGGGTLSFGPHHLIVPAGALSATVRISARTYGDTLAVDLEPHGLQFTLPATLVLNYRDCTVSTQYATGMLYTDSTLKQVLSIVPAQDHYKEWAVSGTINHFSVYAAAETRKPR